MVRLCLEQMPCSKHANFLLYLTLSYISVSAGSILSASPVPSNSTRLPVMLLSYYSHNKLPHTWGLANTHLTSYRSVSQNFGCTTWSNGVFVFCILQDWNHLSASLCSLWKLLELSVSKFSQVVGRFSCVWLWDWVPCFLLAIGQAACLVSWTSLLFCVHGPYVSKPIWLHMWSFSHLETVQTSLWSYPSNFR